MRLPDPGAVEVSGRRDGDQLFISITNPTRAGGGSERAGNQMAILNIRERLALAFGGDAGLEIESGPGRFRVTLAFPYQRSQP
jgi:two-component system sensor histidine kinase AlgZ